MYIKARAILKKPGLENLSLVFWVPLSQNGPVKPGLHTHLSGPPSFPGMQFSSPGRWPPQTSGKQHTGTVRNGINMICKNENYKPQCQHSI